MALRLVYICSFYEYKYAYPGSGPAGPVREGGMVEGALAHRGVRTARRAPATPKPKAGLVPDLGRLSRGSGGPVQGPPILWP